MVQVPNRRASKNKPRAAQRARVLSIIAPLFVIAAIGLSNVAVRAEEVEEEAQQLYFADASLPIERISVIGSRVRKLEIPGAAAYIGPDDLEIFEYGDIHRILRQVPGVNIQEEDGFGLRPNIGIRGTGLERSSRITLMEDGVLIAPAPYAAPAAYYFPTAGRLEAVEVRKGSSAIKFGPRTTGGAVNLISTSIPEYFGGFVKARFGEYGHKEVHAAVGGRSGAFGVLAETFQAGNDGFKRLPAGGDTGFDIEDYVLKLSLSTPEGADREHSFEIKLGYTDQRSNETYLGITDEDFARHPFRRYAASANDVFNSEHYQIQATHFVEFGSRTDLTTVGYYNEFERDWFKLDDLDLGDGRGRIRPSAIFDDLSDPLNIAALSILKGEADSIDDALQLRHNAREYYSWGIQSLLRTEFATGAVDHALEFGLRYHKDQEDRLQNREKFRMESGTLVPTSVDAPGSQANRVADARAFAAFIQNEMLVGNWRIVPGVRLEQIKLVRADFSRTDPERALGPTGSRTNRLTSVVPGLGVVYAINGEWSAVAGIHKGFSPPGPSQSQASEEESLNVEAGARYNRNGTNFEAIGFFSGYSNLIGTCSNAVGCVVGEVGDQFNAGEVDVFGLEVSAGHNFDVAPTVTMPVSFSYTLTHAEFRTSFTDGFWGDVDVGDRLPYIPGHQLNISVGLEGLKWAATLNANYVSATRNTAGRGRIAQLDRIDERVVVDLSGSFELLKDVRLQATVENLFDNRYVVARRPYGPRPGKPRTLIGGISVRF